MQRDLATLECTTFDLLVVGGGITGAWIACDAARRGLRTALIERDDFGGATSANSLKTIHGGLRYLQDGDLALVRRMIHERRAWLQVAPHLVWPLPVLLPTYGAGLTSAAVLGLALLAADRLGWDRNQGVAPDRQLPPGRLLSRADCLRLLPGIDPDGITGAAMWYDGQIQHSERLLLAVLHAAARAGAVVANYLAATAPLRRGNEVSGVQALDRLSGGRLAVRARLVVNASGPWGAAWLDGLAPALVPSLAWNLVTRQFVEQYAAGLRSRYAPGRSRVLFAVPWQGFSIVGTLHAPLAGPPGALHVDDARITAFLAEINRAYPGAQLTHADVRLVHQGILPARAIQGERVRLLRDGAVVDHRRSHGVTGLLSAIGVKFTSARSLAERVVDMALRLSGWRALPCSTHTHPLPGAGPVAGEPPPAALAPEARAWLVARYGAEYPVVLAAAGDADQALRPVAAGVPLLHAELRYFVRHEQARSLADVLLRRSTLGSAGHPGLAVVRAVAAALAADLGWDARRQEHEIDVYHTVASACMGGSATPIPPAETRSATQR